MKTPFKPWLGVLAGLALAAAAPSTRADTFNQGLFQLGGDLWEIENLAQKGNSKFAVDKQALTKLLELCIQDCRALGFPCDSLLDLQRRQDKLSFPQCARRLEIVQADILKHMKNTFGPQPLSQSPSAQSYFLLGRYTTAATVTALYVKLSGKEKSEEYRNFIYGMCLASFSVRNNAKLEVNLAPLLAVIGKVKQGASFAELHDGLLAVSRSWYRELGKTSPLAIGVRPPARPTQAE
jgi:hypothetical protein